jgi:hypothetical protein
VEKSDGKPGRGDLVVKDAQLGGFRDPVVDVVFTREFGGSHLADVSLNGQLRDHDPNRPLENEAGKKVERYRDGYANRTSTTSCDFTTCRCDNLAQRSIRLVGFGYSRQLTLTKTRFTEAINEVYGRDFKSFNTHPKWTQKCSQIHPLN